MIRLFYLVSTIGSVKEISDNPHEHGVTAWRFHVVSADEAELQGQDTSFNNPFASRRRNKIKQA